jgi:hypothetical protein
MSLNNNFVKMKNRQTRCVVSAGVALAGVSTLLSKLGLPTLLASRTRLPRAERNDLPLTSRGGPHHVHRGDDELLVEIADKVVLHLAAVRESFRLGLELGLTINHVDDGKTIDLSRGRPLLPLLVPLEIENFLHTASLVGGYFTGLTLL